MRRPRYIPDDYDGDLDDDSEFADWCADNDIDPDEDDDARASFKESQEERRDPYGSRGLRMRDFL